MAGGRCCRRRGPPSYLPDFFAKELRSRTWAGVIFTLAGSCLVTFLSTQPHPTRAHMRAVPGSAATTHPAARRLSTPACRARAVYESFMLLGRTVSDSHEETTLGRIFPLTIRCANELGCIVQTVYLDACRAAAIRAADDADKLGDPILLSGRMDKDEERTVLLCGSDLWDGGVRISAYVRAGMPQAGHLSHSSRRLFHALTHTATRYTYAFFPRRHASST